MNSTMGEGQITRSAVEAILAEFQDPETGRGVMHMEQVRDIQVEHDRLSLTLALTTHSAVLWEETRSQLQGFLKNHFPWTMSTRQ
jgi:ATP-binding protein involved in chromosome partitioning